MFVVRWCTSGYSRSRGASGIGMIAINALRNMDRHSMFIRDTACLSCARKAPASPMRAHLGSHKRQTLIHKSPPFFTPSSPPLLATAPPTAAPTTPVAIHLYRTLNNCIRHSRGRGAFNLRHPGTVQAGLTGHVRPP